MSEKWTYKESWSTDLSPTTHLLPAARPSGPVTVRWVGEVYPGWGRTGWVPGGAIPGTTQAPSQGPIFSIFQVIDPTHGQMKAFLVNSMRFPRMGLEWVQE